VRVLGLRTRFDRQSARKRGEIQETSGIRPDIEKPRVSGQLSEGENASERSNVELTEEGTGQRRRGKGEKEKMGKRKDECRGGGKISPTCWCRPFKAFFGLGKRVNG
jgi:hypothetical protein